MKKNAFQSQHASFFLKKSHNFDGKRTFYRIFIPCFYIRNFSKFLNKIPGVSPNKNFQNT